MFSRIDAGCGGAARSRGSTMTGWPARGAGARMAIENGPARSAGGWTSSRRAAQPSASKHGPTRTLLITRPTVAAGWVAPAGPWWWAARGQRRDRREARRSSRGPRRAGGLPRSLRRLTPGDGAGAWLYGSLSSPRPRLWHRQPTHQHGAVTARRGPSVAGSPSGSVLPRRCREPLGSVILAGVLCGSVRGSRRGGSRTLGDRAPLA